MADEIWAEHVGILRCPISGQALSLLSAGERAQVRAAIKDGTFVAPAIPSGAPAIDSAVGTADRQYVYLIDDGIALLLPALAILPRGQTQITLDLEKKVVQEFYDSFGWHEDDAGNSMDAAQFTATNVTARKYISACNDRISAVLSSGRYLLDVACGVIADDYIRLSRNFTYRVCVDLSILALRKTKAKLGNHALCVLGDITRLPLADGAVDDAVSLHTIYHVPVAQQSTAVGELVRVVRSGGRAVVVYTWKYSPLMNMALGATMTAGRLRRIFRQQRRQLASTPTAEAPPLYFNPQGREWVRELRRFHPVELRLWSASNAQFQAAMFKDTPFGRLAAAAFFRAEAWIEPITARFGQYPMLVIAKQNLGS